MCSKVIFIDPLNMQCFIESPVDFQFFFAVPHIFRPAPPPVINDRSLRNANVIMSIIASFFNTGRQGYLLRKKSKVIPALWVIRPYLVLL